MKITLSAVKNQDKREYVSFMKVVGIQKPKHRYFENEDGVVIYVTKAEFTNIQLVDFKEPIDHQGILKIETEDIVKIAIPYEKSPRNVVPVVFRQATKSMIKEMSV